MITNTAENISNVHEKRNLKSKIEIEIKKLLKEKKSYE